MTISREEELTRLIQGANLEPWPERTLSCNDFGDGSLVLARKWARERYKEEAEALPTPFKGKRLTDIRYGGKKPQHGPSLYALTSFIRKQNRKALAARDPWGFDLWSFGSRTDEQKAAASPTLMMEVEDALARISPKAAAVFRALELDGLSVEQTEKLVGVKSDRHIRRLYETALEAVADEVKNAAASKESAEAAADGEAPRFAYLADKKPEDKEGHTQKDRRPLKKGPGQNPCEVYAESTVRVLGPDEKKAVEADLRSRGLI
jgi:hypothetical protein